MSPRFKKNNNQTTTNTKVSDLPQFIHEPAHIGIPFKPMGMPGGVPTMMVVGKKLSYNKKPEQPPMPGANLPRALNYYADYGGCGFWRMVWPELLLNGEQRAIINGLTTMVADPRFYTGLKAVRLQRQATPMQLKFVKFLKTLQTTSHDFKIIYEIDDIIFRDDIPDFNKCKMAFADDKILQSSLEMMQICDEISVTCQYMKDYYADKTGNKKITVIPNYAPKFWADGFYDMNKLNERYNKYKKRPRIGYCGSGTHIDISNNVNQQDDFYHIVQHIIKTRKDFKWVMMGCFPLPIKPFIDSGEIEFAPWSSIFKYPQAMYDLNLNATIAPLADCAFNRAKSNIKYLESAYQGIPGVYQDIITYKDAPLRFKTGNELIDRLKYLLENEDIYMKYSTMARAHASKNWLDDHLDEYQELYFTKFNDSERKALLINNPIK